MRKTLTVGSLIPERQAPLVPSRLPEPALPNKPSAQSLIRLRQNGTEYSIRPVAGQLLLDAALAQLQPLTYKCRKGSCGKCTVQLLAGGQLLQPPTREEQAKLDAALAQGYRLACQACIGLESSLSGQR
jgi:ferredoxin